MFTDELKNIWKEIILGLIDVLFRHLSGEELKKKKKNSTMVDVPGRGKPSALLLLTWTAASRRCNPENHTMKPAVVKQWAKYISVFSALSFVTSL
jgi:hypothetical protein